MDHRSPPGIARPWPADEYIFDGGDRRGPVQVARDWTVYGLDQEDTVVHYDTLNGDTRVQPSNRVPIYAPRFAATRKVTSVSEITGMEGNIVTTQELYVFDRQGYDERHMVRGRFRTTGIRPKFGEKLFAAGIQLPDEIFSSDTFAPMNR